MGTEIERKFLVDGNGWRQNAQAIQIRQGFLSTEPDRTVRVRAAGESGTLTIKSKNIGATRQEFEYNIPLADAHTLLDKLCERPLIEKTRYVVRVGPHAWEVDVFEGDNTGLIVAEIELAHEDESFEQPPWLGDEVTHDARYFNSNLVKVPFSTW